VLVSDVRPVSGDSPECFDFATEAATKDRNLEYVICWRASIVDKWLEFNAVS
jgi:hypothetical protein